MIHEVIYYEFDDVPIDVKVNGNLIVIDPSWDMVKEVGKRDVNLWISVLVGMGSMIITDNGRIDGYVFVGVWNTGWGGFQVYYPEDIGY